MDNFTAGISLILTGIFVWFVTYKKYHLFWDFFDAKLLRRFLGDTLTAYLLYLVSVVFIIIGYLLLKGFIL